MFERSFSQYFCIILFSIAIYCQLNGVSSNPPNDSESDAHKYSVESIEKDEMLLQQYIRDAKDWALAHGLVLPSNVLGCKDCKKRLENVVFGDMTQIAPFSLFPSPFPRELFKQAMEVHKAIQLLYFRAASNFDFIKDVHKELIKTDGEFKDVFESIEKRHLEGIKQPLTLYCNRADYMASKVIDEKSKETKYVLKQIEANSGAMGGYGTSSRVTALHRRMLSIAGVDASPSVVPENHTGTMFATALYRAWLEFGNPEAVILFLHNKYRNYLLVEAREVQHEIERISGGKAKCFFLSLKQAVDRLTFPDDFSTILDNKYVVAISLSRYSAYSSPEEVVTARAIRRSTAIQVATSVFILAQSKKTQQTFTNPGVVEQFFRGPKEAQMAAEVRKVLTRSWSIGEDEENAEEIIKMVRANPEKYVMKWNECGSRVSKSILFGDKIIEKLDNITKEEREKFFIMEKLEPMVVKNHFVLPHKEPVLNVNVTPELGIHGCMLGNIIDGTVIDHFWTESQMKTKLAEVDEGGVMKGNSVFDSPYLV